MDNKKFQPMTRKEFWQWFGRANSYGWAGVGVVMLAAYYLRSTRTPNPEPDAQQTDRKKIENLK
jgi:hypothetical protein